MYHATTNSRIRTTLFTVLLAATALSMGPSASAEQALAAAVDSDAIQWGPCPPFFAEGCQIGVLHGDPAKPNADVFFRVPGNYDLPRHWHTSAERMILVAGEMDVTYEGQDTVSLKEGMYAYSQLQEREFVNAENGYRAARHGGRQHRAATAIPGAGLP